MSSYLEFEGKNVDNAIEKACSELKLSKHRLKYDVISTGSSGIFALIGIKKAKIKVYVPQYILNKVNNKNNKQKNSKEGVISLVDEAFSSEFSDENSNKKVIPEYPEEIINKGKEALQNVVDLITTDSNIEVEKTYNSLFFRIEGGNSALLIGRRGRTLEAIQYIIDKIINKFSTERIRIQIDVEGYLNTRKESLQNLAIRMAEKARRTGRPSSISQMTAYDRRIVHLTLKNDKSVKTQSVGEGYYRRLVIFPQKNNNYRNDRRTSSYSRKQ